jgi:hypothetical protein
VDRNIVFGVSDLFEIMGSGEPNSEELIVKAKYFLRLEPTEENLRQIQTRFTQILREDEYITDNAPTPYVTLDRTMKFVQIPPEPKKSRWDKLKEKVGAIVAVRTKLAVQNNGLWQSLTIFRSSNYTTRSRRSRTNARSSGFSPRFRIKTA